MYSTFSHRSQETFSTENVLTGSGPHRRFEHLLTNRAVEIIFGVRSGRGEVLGHGEGGESRRRQRQRQRPRWQRRPGPDSLRELWNSAVAWLMELSPPTWCKRWPCAGLGLLSPLLSSLRRPGGEWRAICALLIGPNRAGPDAQGAPESHRLLQQLSGGIALLVDCRAGHGRRELAEE